MQIPRYQNPNDAAVASIGSSLAKLFAPPDHQRQLEYMRGAENVNRLRASADRQRAAADLDHQKHDNLAAFTPEVVSDAGLANSPAMASIVAHALGLGGNAQQAIDAVNHARGGHMLANNPTEGEARTGYALTGHSAGATSPLTQQGVGDLFAQQTAINDADNARALKQTGITAAARLAGDKYTADQRLAGTRYTADRGHGADNAPPAVSLNDYAKIGSTLASSLPGASAADIADAAQRTVAYMGQGAAVGEAERQAMADVFGSETPQQTAKFDGPAMVLKADGSPEMTYNGVATDQRPNFPAQDEPAAAQPADAQPDATHALPEKLPPSQWADAIKQANDAVRNGADPKAVRQRLRELGVRLRGDADGGQ